MRTRVSVVIPTHGREAYLMDALQSVLNQTRQPYEIIVVDDLAKESTKKLVTSITSNAFDVLYVANPNRGVSSSRNLGAKLARGSIIAFLDDDDMWDESLLEVSLLELQRCNADYAVVWFDNLQDGKRWPGKCISELLNMQDLILRNPGITGSNIVLGANVFDVIGGFDERLCVSEDKDIYIRMKSSCFAGIIIKKGLVVHRIHIGGTLSRDLLKMLVGRCCFYNKYRSLMTFRSRIQYLAKLCCESAVIAAMNLIRLIRHSNKLAPDDLI